MQRKVEQQPEDGRDDSGHLFIPDGLLLTPNEARDIEHIERKPSAKPRKKSKRTYRRRDMRAEE